MSTLKRHARHRILVSLKQSDPEFGVPISPAVRGPALPIREEAHENVESVLREAGLLRVREVG
jgi:hypothetical protein